MKTPFFYRAFTALSLICFFCFSQLQAQVQQHVMYLPEQQIDLRTATPVVSAAPGSPSTAMESNGVHDANGNMIMKVVDGAVYNRYNNLIGYLQNYGSRGYTHPVLIIPVKGELCSYYIVYADYQIPMPCCVNGTEPCCFNGTDTRYAKVDLSAASGQGAFVSNGVMLASNTSPYWEGMAVSTANGSGNRFLYLIQVDNPIIVKRFLVDGSGISFQAQFTVASSAWGLSTGETELSHDGSKLAVSTGYNGTVFMVHLNPATGTLNTTLGTGGLSTYNMPSSGHAYGIEFSPDNSRLFVSDKYATGIRYITLSTGVISAAISGTANWGASSLELGYDAGTGYRIIALKTSNELGLVTALSGTPAFTATGITTYGGYDFYTSIRRLPKQIDGEDYIARFSGSTGTTACCAFNSGIDVGTYNVTSTQTWSGTNPINGTASLVVGQELRVKTGVYLTLNNLTVRFLDQARVVVEPGARLTLNNTTLTSVNCGTMWLGVEVQGNASVAQSVSTHGWLYANAGTVISNALEGVRLCSTYGAGSPDYTKSGGVIRATGATFRNNKRDVEFLAYPFNNTSSFSDCTFIIDAALNNGQVPNSRITMHAVKGINILGCDFKNTTTGLYPVTQRASGLYTIDASYRVDFRCPVIVTYGSPCPSRDESNFEGFVNGISSSATSTAYTSVIRYSNFSNNRYGISLTGISMPVVVENDIAVPDPTPYGGFIPVSVGLYTDNCTGYQVENNRFTYAGPASGLVFGAWIYNSNNGGVSADVNRVYNNHFTGFVAAAAASGANAQLIGGNAVSNTGLTFKCNKFSGTTGADLYFFGQVSPFQGTCLTTPAGTAHAPANNLFSVPASPWDIYNSMGSSFQVDYRYSPSTTQQTAPRAGLYDITNTTVTACSLLPNYSNASCPVTVFDGLPLIKEKSAFDHNAEADRLQALLDKAGNTKMLQLLYTTDAAKLPITLRPYAPYLGNEVLLALLNRIPAVSAADVTTILKANAPLSVTVLNAAETSALTAEQKKELKAEAGISPVQELLSQIAYHRHEAALQQNESVRGQMQDGNSAIAAEYIPGATLSAGDKELQRILNRIEGTEAGIFTLLSDENLRSEMEVLAARRDGSRESVRAAMILQFVLGTPYEPELPELPVSKPVEAAEEQNPHSLAYAAMLKIYPNPAREVIYVQTALRTDEKVLVKIYSVSGVLLSDTFITAAQAQVSTAMLKDGMYLMHITLPDGTERTERILIQR